MERQEHLIGSFQIMPNFSICWVVLAVLLFVQIAYSNCITSSNRYDLPFEGVLMVLRVVLTKNLQYTSNAV